MPLTQFHSPSVVQAPDKVPEPELELELEPEPEPEEVATGAGGAELEATCPATSGMLETVAAGTDAKVDEATTAGVFCAAAEEEPVEPEDSELEPESEPELELELDPELESPEPPKVAVPVQASEPSGARLEGSPSYSTYSPG